MAGLRDHTEFSAWKLSDEVRTRVRAILKRPALRKDFSLWNQLKKSSESPGPNLAEGFSRYKPRDFARFANIAKSSLSEVIEHMAVALAQGYVDAKESGEIVVLARRARGATTRLILYLQTAKEPPTRRTPKRRTPRGRSGQEPDQ